MGGRVKAAERRLTRRVPPGARKRLAAVAGPRALAWYRRRRTDVVLVSFPKCGRTWLRFMVGRAFQAHYGLPGHADVVELGRLAELDPRVPRIEVTHDDDPQTRAAADVERDKSRYRDRRVVLLVRDPRDVIVSLYHQMHGRRRRYRGTLDAFVDEPVGGFASLLAFYDAWAAAIDVPAAVLVVRYEDLHADPARELARVLAFAGAGDVPDAVVADAVEQGAFANMRAVEEAGGTGSDKLRPVRPGDVDTYKTRRGVVGGFRDELGPEVVARLDARLAVSPGAARFGYGPGTA